MSVHDGPADRGLDGALAAWAATVRLPDDTAAAIYRRIVATPVPDLAAVPVDLPAAPGPEPAAGPGLDPAWWRTFTVDFTERLVASTRPQRWAA